MRPTFYAELNNHLGMHGPAPAVTPAELAEWLRDKADDECPADDAWILRECAELISPEAC